jgi:hypothetical protein
VGGLPAPPAILGIGPDTGSRDSHFVSLLIAGLWAFAVATSIALAMTGDDREQPVVRNQTIVEVRW